MPRLSRTRDSVETPLVFSSVRVICVDEAANTVFAARNSNDDEILYCQRSQGEAVAIFVIDRGDIPDQVSGLRVESDNVGVERGHEYFVAEDGKSAIDAAATWPDVRRELTLVEPDRASSTSVESERAVVLAGGIEDAVHHERRGFKFAGCGCLIHPFRDQRSSIGSVDLVQRAEAAASVVA